jgi:hypothetical protein
VCAGGVVVVPAGAHDDTTVGQPPFALVQDVRKADMVFRGVVTGVAYRESQSTPILDSAGQPVLDEDRRPALTEGSGTPHTFVTFRILSAFKGGSEAGRSITLRFFGGIADRTITDIDPAGRRVQSPLFVRSDQDPVFDVGDQDVLFVSRNGSSSCPLVRCAATRFRTVGGFMYSELGNELVALLDEDRHVSGIDLGPPRDLEAFRVDTIGGYRVGRRTAFDQSDGKSERAARKGPRLSRQTFDKLVTAAVRKAHSREELARLPKVPSADPRVPFTAASATSVPAPVPADVSASLPPAVDPLAETPPDDLARRARESAAEEAAFETNDGNPVLR